MALLVHSVDGFLRLEAGVVAGVGGGAVAMALGADGFLRLDHPLRGAPL